MLDLTQPTPLRRRGALGVHSINEFCFSVPDLAAAERFYRAFGLDVRSSDGHLALYTFGQPHCWGRLIRGASKRLQWLSFGAFEDNLVALYDRICALGVPTIDAPAGADASGIWIHGFDGLPLQIVGAQKKTPDVKSSRILPAEQSLAGRAPTRRTAGATRPRRFSHLLLFTTDVNAAIEFYVAVLGLRLSDQAGDGIAFLHAPHGSDHHLIGLAQSPGYGLHHTSWDVESIDALGQGEMQMVEAGYAAGWGIGRHVLGSNYFYYARDPWDSYAEYSYDIDHVAADQEWPAAAHPAEDAFYVWAPNPPEDFAVNYEAQV